ncbi:hydroxyisourate hydrolase [Novosphingobium sp. BW1]|uniref:hydroxyisourate hydrolase n=1 Tax=Novosphingobium sp. BW1 TaxID=2592621 RepID=UPI0011DEBEA9|nr:hydroxyisourate hydrolase [Novosphingobium sp. BW1]TYC89202.1 hydroxyisourate hydrolase [Novosphingobium sp. BW1]
MNTLSTHILDTAHGTPASGVAIELIAEGGSVLFTGTSNADGRCPDLPQVPSGGYHLRFAVADYFREKGVHLPEPPFLDVVQIDFGIAETGAHYHVPLLVSPYGYSTYRGS